MPTLTDRASRLRRLVHSVSSGLRWLPPTVARLTLGWVFLQSGWGKLHDLPKVVGSSRSSAFPLPQFQAPLAATAEFVCGALLLLGLVTRVASLPLIAIMIVAIVTAKRGDIHELSDLFGMSGVPVHRPPALARAAMAPGPLSLDSLVRAEARARGAAVAGGERRPEAVTAHFAGKSFAAGRPGGPPPFACGAARRRAKRPNLRTAARSSRRGTAPRCSPHRRSSSSPARARHLRRRLRRSSHAFRPHLNRASDEYREFRDLARRPARARRSRPPAPRTFALRRACPRCPSPRGTRVAPRAASREHQRRKRTGMCGNRRDDRKTNRLNALEAGPGAGGGTAVATAALVLALAPARPRRSSSPATSTATSPTSRAAACRASPSPSPASAHRRRRRRTRAASFAS